MMQKNFVILLIFILISNPVFLPQISSNSNVTGNGITIAIIDTGIDYNHPDLGGGFGDGRTVIGGYDFIDDDSDPMDELGHGTHIAGIIINIAPNSKLLAYRVVDYNGLVKSSDVIRAMDLAISDGADVINLSLGSMSESNELRKSIKQLTNSGIIVVTAVGNSGPIFGSIGDPAQYEDVISVGSQYTDEVNSTLAIINIDSIEEDLIGLPLIDSVPLTDNLNAELKFVNYARNEDLIGIDLSGKIAVAKRRGAEPSDIVYFSQKESNVAKNGALGLIIINTMPGLIKGRLLHPGMAIDYKPSIPTLLITQEDGEKILEYIEESNTTITMSFRNDNLTNFVSLFSSRGPVSSFYTKPDLVSFGEQVNSTWLDNSYKFQNGTSFSAPQVTGTVALLLELHGDLNKDQILGILGPSASPLTNSYNLYLPSTLQGSGSLNIDKALQSPISIHQSQLSFNLGNQQPTNSQLITLESLVSDSLEISLDHDLQNKDIEIIFNSSTFVLNGKESVVVELNNNLLKSIQESHVDEFRLLIKTNYSNTVFTIPVSTYFHTISLDIENNSESHIVRILGIENYDQALLRIYNTDNAEVDEQIFSFNEEILLNLSPGTYWINAIISSNDNFEFGGIEYIVNPNSNLSILDSNYDSSTWIYAIIILISIMILVYYTRKSSL
jgi:minor extracellular serine protease Vpr